MTKNADPRQRVLNFRAVRSSDPGRLENIREVDDRVISSRDRGTQRRGSRVASGRRHCMMKSATMR